MNTQLVIPKHPLVQVGADPEFFIRPIYSKSPCISAIPFFKGKKGEEEKLSGGRGTVIHDNVAVEITMPPASDRYAFSKNINDARDAARSLLHQRAAILGIKGTFLFVTDLPSFRFTKEEIEAPEAQEFGCEPDFSAWELGVQNTKPLPSKAGNLRVAGGHIHVGVLKNASERVTNFLESNNGKIAFVKLLEMTVGTFVAALERRSNPAAAIRRRTLYGKAGAFRPKEYGVEYRSPSSVWLTTNPNIHDTFDLVQACALLVDRCENPDALVPNLMEELKVDTDDVVTQVNMSRPNRKLRDWVDAAQQE